MPVDVLEHQAVLLPAVGTFPVRVDVLFLVMVSQEVKVQFMMLVELHGNAQLRTKAVHVGVRVAQKLLVLIAVLFLFRRWIWIGMSFCLKALLP